MIATEDRIWKSYGIIGFFNQTVKDLEKLIEKGQEECQLFRLPRSKESNICLKRSIFCKKRALFSTQRIVKQVHV